MINRGVIVARIKRGSEEQVAAIFAESDASELPRLAGVRHRSLFVLDNLYVHLVETEDDVAESIAKVRDHPLFAAISERLKPFIEPYQPALWQTPRDAMAREFYRWEPNAGG